MNKHKLILLVFFLFSIGFLFAQERNFEEEIEDTEKQIQLLQASIKKNNEEIQKVTSQEKTTSQLLSKTNILSLVLIWLKLDGLKSQLKMEHLDINGI